MSLLVASGCNPQTNELKDGYYTAASMDFNEHGWKEYLTICVNNGHITTAEFNAYNEDGLLRSWDMDYLSLIHGKIQFNPNHYPRQYCSFLVSVQNPDKIQIIEGGRRSHEIFVILARAAIDFSRQGKNDIALIKLPPSAYPDDM
ncbi:MAG: FMN-binding protein [Deltaproteobacteria bacterium]|nr:FMN-binding protein [Deltaproteobacteria bacterium]